MATGDLLIDGWDASNANFVLTDIPDWRDFPIREWQAEPTSLRFPHVLTANDPQYQARTLTIRGYVTGTSAANLNANVDTLFSRVDRKGEVTVEFSNDDTTRHFYARLLGITRGERTWQEGPVANNPTRNIVMRWVLLDPFMYDVSLSEVTGISSTGKPIPLGTKPTIRNLTLTLHGPTSPNVWITLKNSTGSTLKTLKLNTTLASTSATRTISMDAGTITNSVTNDSIAERISGSNFPWYLDSRDGVYSSSAYPIVTCGTSTGGANGTLTVGLRRAW